MIYFIDKRKSNVVLPGWSKEITEMVNSFEYISSEFNVYIELQSVSKKGCDLKVQYLIYDLNTFRCWGLIQNAVQGAILKAQEKVRTKCVSCGCDKGEPPSLTVRPGFCEDCRKKITKDSFSRDVAVCLMGKAGSGKDSVAEYLTKKKGFQRMAFADPLRDIIQLSFVLDHDSVWDRVKREQPLIFALQWTVRKLLQFIGTELFRNQIFEPIWVRNLRQRLEPGTNYVITDARFPNEIKGMKEHFGENVLFVEVRRPGYEGKDVGIPNHESEKHVLISDIIIENDGTLNELFEKTEMTIREKINFNS